MRIALFSDIHGNTPGLHAIFEHLDAQGGAELIYSLGDMLVVAPGPMRSSNCFSRARCT